MQGKDLFEYAIVRLVPRVEREEFINVGVVLYCRGQRFLQMQFTLDERRCAALVGELDINELLRHLRAFQKICEGEGSDQNTIAALPPAERFRWLTAKRSAVIQTSPVHPGFCSDAAAMLEQLHAKLVL